MTTKDDPPDILVDVAKAFAKADGIDPKAQVLCGNCGMQHFIWEQHIPSAKRFVEGLKAATGKIWSNDRTN